MGKSESVSRQKWSNVSSNDYPVTSVFPLLSWQGFLFYLLIWNTDKTAVPRLMVTCTSEWEDSSVFKSLWTETLTFDKDDITGSWHLGTFHHRRYLDILTTSEVQLKVILQQLPHTFCCFLTHFYRFLQTCEPWSCCWRQTSLNTVRRTKPIIVKPIVILVRFSSNT